MAETTQDSISLAVRPIETGASFRTLAYARLKEAIAAADIYGRPDEIRLDERQLAAALGVSRTPIREAMTLLEQEGFLRTLPRRGVFIVRKTKREIVEMIQVWAALESMAARLACEHASDAEIASLHTVMDDYAGAAGSAQEHPDEYSDANIAFHQTILRMGGSALIEQMTENLFVHVRAIRRATIVQRDRASRSVEDHMDIIRALEARDAERAERLVRDHTLGLADHVERYCDFLE
jgi:DNA-binding GntR family transcriptional regulator